MGGDKVMTSKKYPDFESIRHDFPAIEKLQAYLDTAYVGLMPLQVRLAHEAFLEEQIIFDSIPVENTILRTWFQKSEKVRSKLATFLGAKDSEVALTYCTGCGANIALNGIEWEKGDNAVVDDIDYPTDIHILNALRKKGVEVRIAKSTNGSVPLETFEPLVDRRTRALVVSHISFLNGFRHNLKRLASLVHNYGGYLVVDGTQSVGAVRVDVKMEEVDLFSGAPYKWLIGPPGVGFFYIREGLIPSFKPDRLGWLSTENFVSFETVENEPLPKHAKRFEYGTLNFEGIYALEVAIDYINRIGIEFIEQHNLDLVYMLRKRLSEKKVRFHTPENNQAPILTIFVDNEKTFGQKMREKKIFVTTRNWKGGQVRISPHFYNNEEDIETFVHAFSAIIMGSK
jgi:cysteine desulfurase/selenocysteine lyase